MDIRTQVNRYTVNPLYLASIIFSAFMPYVFWRPFYLALTDRYNVTRYVEVRATNISVLLI